MSFTNAQLAQKMSDLIDYWSNFATEYSNWLGGAVDGGPSSNGSYPLTDWQGNESLVKSPAKLQDDVDGMVSSASTSADAAAASATAAASSASAASTSASTATAQAALADADRVAAELAETNAEDSAVTATAQANNASSSATAAAASETAAAASETAAAASEAAAAASAAAAATFDPDNFYLRTALDGGQLDNRYYTETEVDASLANYALLTGATFTGGVDIAAASSSAADVTLLSLSGTGENVGHIDYNNAFGTMVRLTGTKEGGGAASDEGKFSISLATNAVLAEVLSLSASGNLTVPKVTATGDVNLSGTLKHTGQFLPVQNGAAGATGIRLFNSVGGQQGYVYADGSGTFGLLNSTGGWAVQIAPAGGGVNLYGTSVNLVPSGNVNLSPTGNVHLTGGKQFRTYDVANTAYLSAQHNGAYGYLSTSVGQLYFGPANGVNIFFRSGVDSQVRVYDTSGAIYSLLSDTDLNLNGKRAISGYDTYMRLNQLGDFANGVYTPGDLRADGKFTFGNNASFFDASANGFHSGKIRMAYGIDGGYADVGGTSAFGATIWSLSDSYTGGAAGNNSVNTSLYGIKWMRVNHPNALAEVGEGLYVLFNGTIVGGIGKDGVLTPNLYFDDTNTKMEQGTGNSVRVQTDSGYVDVGAQNGTAAHFQTDRALFYFNKPVAFDGQPTYHTKGAIPYYDSSSNASAKITVASTAPVSPAQGDIWFDTT